MDASAEFREYLQEEGVLDALTRAFVKLYELKDRPDDAVPFFQKHMNETFPTQEEYQNLLTTLKEKKAALEEYKQNEEKLNEAEGKSKGSNNIGCLHCYDFSKVDKHAANFPRAGVKTLQTLANDLCSPFALKVEKARAIFTWLHHNIEYDTKSYFANKIEQKTPEDTLKEGLAVCEGYAGLFAKLAELANVEVKNITGHGKGYSYKQGDRIDNKENHAWNAVKLDNGNWQLVDSCWGAGQLENEKFNKNFRPTEFTSSAKKFRQKHYPKLDDDQFCATKITWDEYCTMEETPQIFGDFCDKTFSHETIEPCWKKIKPGVNTFIIKSRCEHTRIKPKEQYILLLTIYEWEPKPDSQPLDTKTFSVDSDGTTWTCTMDVENKKVVRAAYVAALDGKDGKGKTVDEYKSAKSQNFKGLIEWHAVDS